MIDITYPLIKICVGGYIRMFVKVYQWIIHVMNIACRDNVETDIIFLEFKIKK